MNRINAWTTYNATQLKAVDKFADQYKVFLDNSKTEREAIDSIVNEIEAAGYRELNTLIGGKTKLKKGEYLTVYCTGDSTLAKGKNKTFYADFKISAKGGTLYLSDAEGNLVQSLKLPRQYGNVSYGLSADGAAYGFLENATPGKKNNAPVLSARLSEPVLTPSGGMFEGSVTVTATGEPPSSQNPGSRSAKPPPFGSRPFRTALSLPPAPAAPT